MNEPIYAIIAVSAVSVISLIGIFTLFVNDKTLNSIIPTMVSFAAGSLLGAAFFDVLPEAVETGGTGVFSYVLIGMLIFFVLERYIHWHHCHDDECEKHYHPETYLNIIGDVFHNFIDGALIAAAFFSGIEIGIITTIAIMAHEIPQEIGEYAILIHGGMKRRKAIFFNFVSSLTAILGVLATFIFASSIKGSIPFILAIAGGGFVYIATADLIPEIHKERKSAKMIVQSLALFFGVLVIALVKEVFPG
ncbi:MAG: ZIP family metal transporter [Candidatus Paceibacterota bacterium]|jgi:zinc and cadmium transporter